MEATEYTTIAENLLKSMNVKFKTKFVKYYFHFDDDKERRDIFRVSFQRGAKRFSLNFGQSLNESTGTGDNPPTSYEVLACITKYEPDSFESFCSEYGYNTDSRKAERVYKSVVKEWNKVNNFFSEQEIEQLQEIQ